MFSLNLQFGTGHDQKRLFSNEKNITEIGAPIQKFQK